MTTTRTRVKIRKARQGSTSRPWRVIRNPEGGFPKTIGGVFDSIAATIRAPAFPTFEEAIDYAHAITHREQS